MSNKLLFNIWRKSILHTFQYGGMDPEKMIYPQSYYYAISNSIFPYFEDHNFADNKDFDEFFELDLKKMSEILSIFDAHFLNDEVLSFYEYEDLFDVKRISNNSPLSFNIDRLGLLRVLRYSFLAGRFNKEFYDKLLTWHPSEAQGMRRDLEDYEIPMC